MKDKESNQQKIPHYILWWFFLDAVVALAPPIYWLADNYHATVILGLPVTLFYFISVSVFIVLSLVVAYCVEYKQGVFRP